MAFDNTDPADLAALKSEVTTDPIALGYDLTGGTEGILALLNDASLNTGGETVQRPVEELDVPDIAEVIVPAEYAALGEYDKAWVDMFINRVSDERLKPYQGKFQSIFAGTATLTAALALRSKSASRAEVLFGVNTNITVNDLVAARDS